MLVRFTNIKKYRATFIKYEKNKIEREITKGYSFKKENPQCLIIVGISNVGCSNTTHFHRIRGILVLPSIERVR